MSIWTWINGDRWKCMIWNEEIHLNIGVVLIDENTRKSLNVQVRKNELDPSWGNFFFSFKKSKFFEDINISKGRPKLILVKKMTYELRK